MNDATAIRALLGFVQTGEAPRPKGLEEAETILAAAEVQGVAGLLYVRLGQAADWPEPVREKLRAGYKESFGRGVRSLAVAARTQELLAEHGLRSLPLKGAAVAEVLYDSVAERPMGDVDVLVLDDWERATGVLSRAGYVAVERADHAWAFREPEFGAMLELHHSVTSAPGLFPIDADRLWTRSTPGTGQIRRRASPEDLVFQLALHCAFQHGFSLRLVQYLDFRRAFERTLPDTERLLEAARDAAAGPALAAALLAAEAVVGAHLPGRLRENLGRLLPTRLRLWLDSRLRDPLSLLVPSETPLARLRWELASGRRLELLRRTLVSRCSSSREAWPRRTVAIASRAVALIGHWGPSTLQSLLRPTPGPDGS